MANPFLVLGGIAISVATAAFGILQVPGWVASAQDAAAVNDVAQVTAAQSAALSETGFYNASVEQLRHLGSVKLQVSDGVRVYTAADPTRKHTLTVARSASGTFFARTSERAQVGDGPTAESAVVAAGTTVQGPAGARVTAENVPLPSAGVFAEAELTNLFTNPSFEGPQLPRLVGLNATMKTGWAADGSRSLAPARTASLDTNAYADAASLIEGGITALEPNTVYTVMAVYNMHEPFQVVPVGGAAGTLAVDFLAGMESVNGENVAGVRALRLTFTTPDVIDPRSTIRLYAGDVPSAPHRISWDSIALLKGDVPAGSWFSGDSPERGGLKHAWLGEPHNSPSVSYR